MLETPALIRVTRPSEISVHLGQLKVDLRRRGIRATSQGLAAAAILALDVDAAELLLRNAKAA
jgi:hypothetical protein